jgi:hypothetical protein
MIKPLIAKTFGIEFSYATSTAPAYATNRSRQRPNPAGYVREDGETNFELAKYNDGQYHRTTVRGGGSDANSETHILPESTSAGFESNRVLKTTEIVVKTVEKED